MYSKKNTFKGFSETTSVNQVVDKWTHSGLKSCFTSFACVEKLFPNTYVVKDKINYLDKIFTKIISNTHTCRFLTRWEIRRRHTSNSSHTYIFSMHIQTHTSLSHNKHTHTHLVSSHNHSHTILFSLSSHTLALQINSYLLQVDFVPTFSLLLGLPIPFSNLGAIIPDALTQSDEMFSATKQLQYIGLNLDQGNLNRRWC